MKLRTLFVVALIALSVTSCLSPVDSKPQSFYTLTPNKKALPTSQQHMAATLLVSTPSSAPGYNSSKMVYVTIPYKLKAFADNAWVASPARMFAPLVASTVRQMDYFGAVVSSPFAGYTNYVLNTSIETLQQEFMQPTSQVRFIVFASVISSDTSKVIASQHFAVTVAAPGNDPYAGVLASNTAANKVADQIALFVKKAVMSDQASNLSRQA